MEKHFCDVCEKEVKDIKLNNKEEYDIEWFHYLSCSFGDWEDICPACLYIEIKKCFEEIFGEVK